MPDDYPPIPPDRMAALRAIITAIRRDLPRNRHPRSVVNDNDDEHDEGNDET